MLKSNSEKEERLQRLKATVIAMHDMVTRFQQLADSAQQQIEWFESGVEVIQKRRTSYRGFLDGV